MKFMMFIKHNEALRPEQIPQAMQDAMGEFVTRCFSNGVLKDTAGLKPTAEGKRIRLKGGKLTTTDGPFTESKEVVGGYAIVETKTYEEGMKVAREFMDLHRIHWPAFEGESEIRPMEEYEPSPAK
ncbi:MAG: YciI family protein [Bacteroidota bacterium]